MSFDFNPIKHNNINLLIKTLDQARKDIASNDAQKELSAILVFSNHAEYVSKDILRNLRRAIKISSQQSFNGVFFWPDAEEELKKLTLGQIIRELEELGFPLKTDFIRYLKSFNERRIKLMHKLLDESVDQDLIKGIADDFENIFERYLIIQKEIVDKWPYKSQLSSGN